MALRSPAPRLGGQLGHAEVRRTDIQRINDARIQPQHVSGFHEFTFQGTETTQELDVDVVFPCWFVDRPSFSFGGELLRDILPADTVVALFDQTPPNAVMAST